jgi:hypothetical protein
MADGLHNAATLLRDGSGQALWYQARYSANASNSSEFHASDYVFQSSHMGFSPIMIISMTINWAVDETVLIYTQSRT